MQLLVLLEEILAVGFDFRQRVCILAFFRSSGILEIGLGLGVEVRDLQSLRFKLVTIKI
jgi:hypothetical protein